MQNKKATRVGNYQTAWNSGWKSPCILMHLMSCDRKVRGALTTLHNLGMKIVQHNADGFFSIVRN